MASVKDYAYYMEGSKISLVEKEAAFDNDPNSRDYGPGTDRFQYKSALSDVTDGLEILYSYSPIYRIQSTGTEGTDFHRFIGWGSDGTNLLLFTYGAAAVADLSSLFYVDDWIVIEGSGRWSGLHQVKSTGGSTGILTLKTKCNLKPSTISVAGSFADIGGMFNGDNAAADMDIEAWKDLQSTRNSPYIFVDVAVDAVNNGIFKVSYPTTSGQIDFTNKITIDADGDYTSTTEGIVDEDGDTVTIYNMFYEQISVYEGIDVLSDESDEIDLPEYLSKAVVHYVRSKYLEDAGQFKEAEYFMAKFNKQVEKYNNAKIPGIRIVAPGPYAIR